MKLLKKLPVLIMLALCSFMLGACGGPAKTSDEGTVQDIQPGDQSVIQVPAPAPERGTTLEERPL